MNDKIHIIFNLEKGLKTPLFVKAKHFHENNVSTSQDFRKKTIKVMKTDKKSFK